MSFSDFWDILIGLCAIVAVIKASRAARDITRLAHIVKQLQAQVDPLTAPAAAPPAIPDPAATEAAAPPPPEPPAAPAAPPPPVSGGWEKRLTENWLVWLGGLALALGGAFLVRLSIQRGLLTPPVRVALGVLLGLALAAAAEAAARQDRRLEGGASRPFPVPQALAAAGCATVFASLYAAYQLYSLLPAGAAFLLLAGTAAATVGLALRHGPFIALLGLLGAFAVPLLVRSDTPHAAPLFAYLTLVSIAALVILRIKNWWWLAWIALGGSLGWTLIWLASAVAGADTPVIGGFLLGQAGLFIALRLGIPAIPRLAGRHDDPMVPRIVKAALGAVAVILALLIQTDGFGGGGLLCALLLVLALLALATRDPEFDDLLAVAGLLPLALLALWPLPPADRADAVLSPALPAEIRSFLLTAGGFLALLGLGGFLLRRQAPRPGRWAALSVAAPLALLVVAYWRLQAFGQGFAWTLTGLALAALALAAAERIAHHRSQHGTPEPAALAAYAVGVLGGTIFAATMALENAWLTVALALHLPALGWVDGRLRLPVLRRLALGVAATVLVRLLLNPVVLHYSLAEQPIFNWLLYGYGIPAAAFLLATRQFGSRADDALVTVLEAGSIAFSTLLLTLEIRHAVGHPQLDGTLTNISGDSLETLLWLGLSCGLLSLGQRQARPVLRWGGILLFTLASGQAVLWQTLAGNPLLTGEAVGNRPLLDSLALAYALPAALYGGIAWRRLGPPPLWQSARLLALVLAFLWLTLEIRHLFQGPVLNEAGSGDAEWYAYSAGWLLFAAGCLALAVKQRSPWLQRAALLGIGLVVGKVFLSDMAELDGLWRALSFLGLGGTLVGIGYAYRRLARK